MKSDRFKGYLFAFLATISFSIGGYVFSKAAMNEIHLAHQLQPQVAQTTGAVGELVVFGFYWFLIAFLLNFAWTAFSGKFTQLKNLEWKQIRILLLLGLLEVLTNTSFYLSLQIIPDPSVTSFLGNLYPVILTLMGVSILKERFSWIESIGVFLALAGAFVISYTGETSIAKMFIPGTLVVLVNAILASTTSVIGKVNVRKLTPEIITLNGTFWLLTSCFILMNILKVPWNIPMPALTNIAAGSFLGPFLGVLMIYYSFKFIEASRSSIVQSLKGIVVLAGSWIYFGTLPLKHQIIGGGLTVIGVLIMTLARAQILRFVKKG
jgi:drug/metabolite transporter (DMT)-like permease